jgi:hypothetical protein
MRASATPYPVPLANGVKASLRSLHDGRHRGMLELQKQHIALEARVSG